MKNSDEARGTSTSSVLHLWPNADPTDWPLASENGDTNEEVEIKGYMQLR